MKTSNILITLFIGSITLYFLAAFTEVRISGHRNIPNTEFAENIIPTEPFHHVVAEGIQFNVAFGEKESITVKSEKGKENLVPAYFVRGDTLTIMAFENADKGNATLHLTLPVRGSNSIDCTRCHIALQGGSADSLTLKLDDSDFTKWSAETTRFSWFKVIASRNSNLVLSAIDISTLDASLDDCLVDIQGPVQTLTGSMVNNTHLTLNEVLDFRFKRDHSSTLNHRN